MRNPEEPIPSHANPDLAKLARAIRSGAIRARASAHRRTIVAGLVLVTTLSIVAALTLPPGSRPIAVGSPGTSPGGSGGPGASAEPWTPLALGAVTSIARITADGGTGRRVAAKSTFTLRSLAGAPATDLAKGLVIEPPTAFSITPGATTDTAMIRPTTRLADGTQYRFRLYASDSSVAGTWAFRTTAPLHAVNLLPGDSAVEVPLNTGIEIEFDQDSPTEIASHFSIEPATPGRFELHARTWAFIPNQILRPATMYTVVVTKGVGVTGSDQVLESDIRFQFETSPASTTPVAPPIAFDRRIVEGRPGIPIDLAMEFGGELTDAPSTVTLDLYRLADTSVALSTARRLLAEPGWAVWSTNTAVPTAGLTRVLHADLPFQPVQGGQYFAVHLPATLDAGWYLAVIPSSGHPQEALLQVSNLGVYAQASDTRSIAWAVDLASVAGVSGVVLTRPDGSIVGRTDAAGLMNVPTPTDFQVHGGSDAEVAPAQLLVATDPGGRRLIVPLGMAGGQATPGGQVGGVSRTSQFWTLLATERDAYRRTDTVHVWGLARSRDDRSVPTNLELWLYPGDGSPDAPIQRLAVTASARGVFTAELKLEDLPTGPYQIDLRAGPDLLMTTFIEVRDIRKPLYSLDMTTDHRVYLAGQTILVTTAAVFFDGTAAPGLELHIADGPAGTTDATGVLALSVPATLGETGFATGQGLTVVPTHPEEGEISGQAGVYVLPSLAWLTAESALTGGQVVLTGTVATVDLAKANQQMTANGELVNPTSGPLSSHAVSVTVVHEVPVKRQIGTSYDFITKRVEPTYEYTIREDVLTTRTLTSDAAGHFRLSVAAPVVTDGYHLDLSTRDAQGRIVKLSTYAAQIQAVFRNNVPPYLNHANGCGGYFSSETVGLDATATVTYHEGDGRIASGGRFLFIVANRGIQSASLQGSAEFETVMRDADLPGFAVLAVHATSNGLSPAGRLFLSVDRDDKTIAVGLTPDRARYAPGGHATIGIRTTDPSGHGIAADVIVRGVDQKLFDLGFAGDFPAGEILYQLPGDGLLQSFGSHPLPTTNEGGCGDEGGRGDFRDTAVFQRVTTDSTGHATLGFDLPDDLTSWHVSATALSAGLDVGSGSVLLPVGLPFFVDATLAPDYLVGEQPILRVRAFGDSLKAGQAVHVTVSAPTLGLAPIEAEGRAFEPIRIPLPGLPAGDHRVTIAGHATATPALNDTLIRIVRVIPTRLSQLAFEQTPLTAGLTLPGGEGLTTYLITDAGRGRLVPLLQALVDGTGARFDQALAAEAARAILVSEFDVPDAQLPPSGFDADRFQHLGAALLPYSEPELFLSATAVLVAPDRLDQGDLRSAFVSWTDSPDVTRERLLAALAGRAGLGDDVLAELDAAATGTLTTRERLWLALGLLASGDEEGARAIERDLLTNSGQRLGPWVRLQVGGTVETTLEASALLLLLASGLGDPIAADVSAYLADIRSTEHLFSLAQLGYIRASLDRLPRTSATFAWTLDGERHVETLELGRSFSLTLTAAQRAALALETLSGMLSVSSSWIAGTTPADLPHDSSISIRRTVTPASGAPEDRLVSVEISVSFGPTVPRGCYRVTDILPSGLAPVAAPDAWEHDVDPTIQFPYAVDGQFVSWCVDPSDRHDHRLGYVARVVSPGTYTWEPAVVQSPIAPTLGSSTPVTIYTIR